MTLTSDNQRLFNDAYLGLKSQGFQRSIDLNHQCVYRSPDGLKCAIGHCIPDTDYHPDMEGYDIQNNLAALEVLDTRYPEYSRSLARELQQAHDSFNPSTTIEDRLKAVAVDFNLEVPDHA